MVQGAGITEWPFDMVRLGAENQFPCRTLVACLVRGTSPHLTYLNPWYVNLGLRTSASRPLRTYVSVLAALACSPT